jgi:diadenylate cyclase
MIELFKIGFISISLLDVLDIAIVAGITLWIYKALKDTIAVQILFGLIYSYYTFFYNRSN